VLLYKLITENTKVGKWATLYEQAFLCYKKGKFKEAQALYQKINDTYSAVMLERLKVLLVTPQLSWNGTWGMG
jgi:dihydrodipicolinate synthase/N-acetylneuraminate lyase